MQKIFIAMLCFITLQQTSNAQTWDTLASVPEGLSFPLVVALNGEIHVIGGGGSNGAADIHLRYKPSTDTWDTLASVPYKAQQPAGAVLDGKIHYFGGGYPNSGTPVTSHYVYNPSTDIWLPAADLPVARVIMEAAAINGKIYAMSGQPEKARVDEYNPATDSWTLKNPLPDNNFWYSAIVVLNNEMYRIGGGGYTAPVSHLHKYNSTNDPWTNVATLPQALHAPAGTALGGLIYFGGGYNGTDLEQVRIFDVNTSSFTYTTPLPLPRSYHEMVTIDTCIYSVGGHSSGYPEMNTSLLRYCSTTQVSVNHSFLENNLLVFPNPATHFVSFTNGFSTALFVELFDAQGAIKIATEGKKGECSINVSTLAPGMYFYRARTVNKGTQYMGKLIIEK
jgi:hypothetical protein